MTTTSYLSAIGTIVRDEDSDYRRWRARARFSLEAGAVAGGGSVCGAWKPGDCAPGDLHLAQPDQQFRCGAYNSRARGASGGWDRRLVPGARRVDRGTR